MNFAEYIKENWGAVIYGRPYWQIATASGGSMVIDHIPQANTNCKGILITQMFLQTKGASDIVVLSDTTQEKQIFRFVDLAVTIAPFNFEYLFTTNKIGLKIDGLTTLNYSVCYQQIFKA